jgi:hypothetical protein
MPKKIAQVTLFVVIALFLIGAFVIIYIAQKTFSVQEKYPLGAQPIISYVNDCLKEKSEEAVLQTGLQAGFYTMPDPFLIYDTEFIPYLYANGQKKLLTDSIVEKEISDYIRDEIKECLANINSFSNFNLSQSNYSVETKIDDGIVAIKLNYPLTVQKGDFTLGLDTFDYQIESNLKGIIEITNELLSEYEKNPGMFCITCFDNIMDNHPFMKVAAVPATSPTIYEDKYIIFILEDEEYKINGSNFVFRFIAEA